MKNELDESSLSDDTLFESIHGVEKDGLVTPIHLLRFAKWILAIIGGIYVLAGLSEIIYPHNNVFETCKVTLPSLATLVIGYYFGTTRGS
jgi:hypothetical protein